MNKPKEILNDLQSAVHKELLKINGFKKSGRTFNRISSDGIIEVINFQSGRHEFGNEIPGLRENLYGNFTINIGICIPEYYEHRFDKTKKFYQEYDCSIRTRIGSLIKDGEDVWWELRQSYLEEQIDRIIQLLNDVGLKWLEQLNSRENIYQNWESIAKNYNLSNNAKLNIATIQILNNIESGKDLYKEYYKSTEKENHKEWLREDAKILNVELQPAHTSDNDVRLAIAKSATYHYFVSSNIR